jgi:signal transduction histidine kinase
MADPDQAEPSAENVSFRTRARTVDHLGRGQIADAPTAVSELWKNAWDAYSESVSLNIFDGDPVVAAIFDAGVGMSARDFVDRWLVIGTESKVDGPPPPPPPDFKGKPRPRQGEKGIGRLSTAFLAPATLVVSKEAGGPYSAVLVDWRFFENPFLSIDEITLPVRVFSEASAILPGLPEMVAAILDNLGPLDENGERQLRPSWQRVIDNPDGAAGSYSPDKIVDFWKSMPVGARHFEEWPVYANLEPHGTALYLLGAHHELSVWLHSAHEDEEAKAAKQRLTDILTGFTDSLEESPVAFDYEVLVYRGATSRRILAATDTFDLSDFRDLEHTVEGEFDDAGVFKGKIKAFGREFGERIIAPPRPLPTTRADRPGPFKFAIGTFEQTPTSSTHNARRHKELAELVERYGGVRVYRDDLRVMPYGSTESDFFSLEEQRSKHAGRYFWAHRRSFGRLAFTRQGNPSLRDKAGREGLVENRASRELRLLVQALLIGLARDYFGTDAPQRAERIAEAQKRNVKGKKAADVARKRRRSQFRSYLTDAVTRMPLLAERARSLTMVIDAGKLPSDRTGLASIRGEIEHLRSDIAQLMPSEVPVSLGDLEQTYRGLREQLDEVSDVITLSDVAVREAEAVAGAATPAEVARATQARHSTVLDELLDGFARDIREGMKGVTGMLTANLADDHQRYERATEPLLKKVTSQTNLPDLLALLELNRNELQEEFADRYRPLIGGISSIAAGVDITTALASVDDDREELDQRVRDLNAVAQLGITVEIIGHELESLDSEVSRAFEALPNDVKTTKAFDRAQNAHRALTEKLRFLSPLQLAGARVREPITGELIRDYLVDFFGMIFEDNEIDFKATPSFLEISFTDLRSRILPVFVNLVNNAIYWVSRSEERVIRLDSVDQKIVVADSGPGVDKDDVWRLFQLFYTRRTAGRGVGLYLSRVNLEAGRHTIRYADQDDPHILPGANFIIELRGLSNAG